MRRGFTLIEMMVAIGVGAVVLAAIFSLAVQQMQSYTEGAAVAELHSSSRVVFESLTRDLRNAGAGTSFYAGAPIAVLGANERLAVRDNNDGTSRGIPAIRIVNGVTTPADVMPGSDAIALLRITSLTTWLEDRVPPNPGAGVPYEVGDFNVIAGCAAADGMVLISDSSRSTSEAESMVLALDRVASIAQSALVFSNGFGIDPSDTNRTSDRSVPPAGMAVGSRVMCVQPVTYWLDVQGRLRLFQSTRANPGGTATAMGLNPGQVPLDPGTDAVLSEGVEDLQFAVFMSAAAPGVLANNWAYVPGLALANEAELAEARVVRTSVLMRTASTPKTSGGPSRIAQLEDHVLTQPAQPGCRTPATCYDPSYRRKALTFTAELRNLRIFDAVSDSSRTTNELRSYHE
ncbi:MAG: prepilin-type N-terminal cleavage/methylation domain-containing protein [Deltaproteobacteria bacterium]|jgi:prepilin-type N-terminal cleavage/methylation domain-containing protein|nr:prepilin-type N-terminal cleavage/methylation domain-containing protein [Deltaproteobacteria bacterium]